jgi:predicted phosphoribosyltransferase
MFQSREDGAHRLAELFEGRELHDPLVLAIPRGGVVTGAVLAQRLGAELDVTLSRKLRAPGMPEVAVGAISELGDMYLSPDAALLASMAYLEDEARHQREEISRRKALFRAVRPPARVAGRTVLVADDGIATGSTMIAALQAARAGGAREVIAASPVGLPGSAETVRPWCDEVVVVTSPPGARSVGQMYRDFHQVEDDEALSILERHYQEAAASASNRRGST